MRSNGYAGTVLKRLSERYGARLHTQLSHRGMVELFVAVLLSPQCTDKQVNAATTRLFRDFKDFGDYANADTKTLAHYLKGLNYYRTKARYLKRACEQIVAQFNGEVPRSMEQMLLLYGVGRKVANVILNEGYGIDEGIAVDTHVATVARRLHLSRQKEPYAIEKDLMHTYPKREWGRVSNTLIELGRDVCKARKKECERCVLNDICPSSSQRARQKAR